MAAHPRRAALDQPAVELGMSVVDLFQIEHGLHRVAHAAASTRFGQEAELERQTSLEPRVIAADHSTDVRVVEVGKARERRLDETPAQRFEELASPPNIGRRQRQARQAASDRARFHPSHSEGRMNASAIQ